MIKQIIVIVVALANGLALNNASATPASDQAAEFIKIYSQCLRNVHDLSSFRARLAPLPTLPSHKASFFLIDRPGDAWPVPSEHGSFVLALPESNTLCAVFGREADTEIVKATFLALVEEAPAPLQSRKVKDEQRVTPTNGLTHTIAYEWSIPDAPLKMLYTLTVAPSKTADLQVVGTANMVVGKQ